jgi:hypothetical protein
MLMLQQGKHAWLLLQMAASLSLNKQTSSSW